LTTSSYKISYPQTPFLDDKTKMPTVAWQQWLQNPSVSTLNVGGGSTGGNYSGIAVTASTINSTTIGVTTPSTGYFTTLQGIYLQSTGVMTLAYNQVSATSSASYSFGTFSVLILAGTGSLTGITVTLPAGALDGQIAQICTNQAISSLTISPNTGQSVNNPATSLSGGQGIAYIYTSSTAWFRLY